MLVTFSKIFSLFTKPETEEQVIIRWADVLIFTSNFKGEIDYVKPFTLDWVYSANPPTEKEIVEWNNHEAKKIRDSIISKLGDIKGQLDKLTKELTKYLEAVKGHLLKEGYIEEPHYLKAVWQLTKKGELAKELGGHKKYQKYRRSEIRLITSQGRINALLIGATILAAVMPFIAAWIFSTKVYNTNVLPAPVYRPDIRIDSVWLRQQVDDEIRKRLSNQPPTQPTSK